MYLAPERNNELYKSYCNAMWFLREYYLHILISVGVSILWIELLIVLFLAVKVS